MNLLLCPAAAAARVMHNARHELLGAIQLTLEKRAENETETVENKLKLTCNASPKDAAGAGIR